MRKFILAFTLIYSVLSSGQNISFPDNSLNFLLLNYVTVDTDNDGIPDQMLDSNLDGFIQVNEVLNVESLVIYSQFAMSSSIQASNLTGLEQFPILESLYVRSSALNNPDISQFPVLSELTIIHENSTTITNLTLNSSTLEKLVLKTQAPALNSIDFSGITLLKEFEIEHNGSTLTLLDFSSLPQLEKINASIEGIISLNLLSNTNLKEVVFTRFGSTPIDFSNNQQLERITIDSNMYGNGLFVGLNALKEINLESSFPANTVTTLLDFSNMQQLEELTIEGMTNLASLDLNTNLLLRQLVIGNTMISSLDFTPNQQLNVLSLNENVTNLSLTNLILSANVGLRELTLNAQNLSNLSLLNNINLELLSLGNVGQNLSIDLSLLSNLRQLNLYGQFGFNALDLSGNTNLESLILGSFSPPLPNLDLSSNPLLNQLALIRSELTEITVDSNPLLNDIFIRFSDVQRVSLNSEVPLERLNIYDNDFLEFITFKNGIVDVRDGFNIFFARNSMLNYICVDEEDIGTYRNVSNSSFHNYPSLEINSYCSFNPGGDFNEIEGTISIDVDNNSCDLTDPVFPNFNFTATDGIITGTLSSNQTGEYYAPVIDGQHTITPNPENPTYWNFSPPNVVVNFPTQTSPFTQDFCVTANGTVEDLEVIVIPLEQARPGFDTDYKVVIKNKGNQTTSGTVTLDFEEDFMNLLSSTPTAANPATNQLSWSVNNLQPFQMEEYEFTMTLNTPTQTTNPLNGGDVLTFTGTVTGTGIDAMPADNMMVFDQTVVNSYDPNDKTCLEGATIEPAMVGEYVHYMIRFENTGTASAINVVIKDEIDLTQFDVSTLIPLGGSHDYYTRVRDANVVEFIHENINLDFNDATNDGYVLFKIKTLTTLTEGDAFDNTAEIYFDFNFPIITNTETVTVMTTASIGEATDSSIRLYPNPAYNFINITANNSIQSASITDMHGRMISQTQFTGSSNEQRVELAQLASGIYFVTVKSDVGEKVEKLIVQ